MNALWNSSKAVNSLLRHFRMSSIQWEYFSTSSPVNDWIRRNTPRKPELFRIPKTATILEDEMVDIVPPEFKTSPEDEKLAKDVYAAVNSAIIENSSRYFAVVHIAGKQFKVTTEDLIMIKTPLFGTDVGDLIRLEKVLLLGSNSFTLVGRPLLDKDDVVVEAQVIEKTLEHPKLWFQFHRRRRHRKMRGIFEVDNNNNFITVFQDNVAVLRITKIGVNQLKDFS